MPHNFLTIFVGELVNDVPLSITKEVNKLCHLLSCPRPLPSACRDCGYFHFQICSQNDDDTWAKYRSHSPNSSNPCCLCFPSKRSRSTCAPPDPDGVHIQSSAELKDIPPSALHRLLRAVIGTVVL